MARVHEISAAGHPGDDLIVPLFSDLMAVFTSSTVGLSSIASGYVGGP